jgi:hypothetical protein
MGTESIDSTACARTDETTTRSASPWDPTFFRRSRLFWPVERAASVLAECVTWPGPDDLTRMFEGDPPVHFEAALPKSRRARLPADARYDARIAVARRVPTRAQSWHDLANALVWATFPRAKLALHLRQHRIISARLGPDLRLPGARTPEQDAIAMLDEGGVALLCLRARRGDVEEAVAREDAGELAAMIEKGWARAAIFGHAIYEALACGDKATVRAAARIVDVEAAPVDAADGLRAADDSIAGLLARAAPLERSDFVSIDVDERLG